MGDKAHLKGFRGGVAYAAANVAPTTARTWPLEIGSRVGEGHKRYDLVDVVMLRLMSHLTTSIPVAAGFVAAALNQVRDRLSQEVDRWLEVRLTPDNRWKWAGGPFLVLLPKRNGGAFSDPLFKPDGEIADFLADRRTPAGVIVVALPRLINAAEISIENVLMGNKPAFEDA